MLKQSTSDAEDAVEMLKDVGYKIFRSNGEWWCLPPWRTEPWMPPVDDRQLINRAATLPVIEDLHRIRRRYGP